MRRIYLFRHGLPDFPGGVHLCLGLKPDLPLSQEGRAAAARWADFLKKKKIGSLWSSPLRRCRETAAAMAGDMAINVRYELHEMRFGEWEGLDFATIRTRYAELYERRGSDMSLMPPGGEQLREAAERGIGTLRAILSETEGDIAVVAHSALNRALLWRISGQPLENIRSFQQDYVHLSVLDWDGENFSIQAVNRSYEEIKHE